MHQENLKDTLFSLIFDDEYIYRKLYLPLSKHISKHPQDKVSVKEFVDNITMKFAKLNNINYNDVPGELKQELSDDVYSTIIDNQDAN